DGVYRLVMRRQKRQQRPDAAAEVGDDPFLRIAQPTQDFFQRIVAHVGPIRIDEFPLISRGDSAPEMILLGHESPSGDDARLQQAANPYFSPQRARRAQRETQEMCSAK